MRIRLGIGGQEAIGTLEDNPVTRDLVSLLPVTVPMGDLFGREKPGPLPRALTGDVEPVFTYRIGQIAYWPPSHDIFVVYDGDGLRVPGPGLVPLGTVDTGLGVIAAAGDDFDMTIAVLD
ncbi:cyclophilin-like fold protein [Blastococcus colisei]|uniref:cyclophilin-like fold protein n=1 Tax=Blastococcus colisei TaxID=1564162 RepID=UPI00114EAC43|nr:cyclophilin-like fold protein [Blastococcus colisei]